MRGEGKLLLEGARQCQREQLLALKVMSQARLPLGVSGDRSLPAKHKTKNVNHLQQQLCKIARILSIPRVFLIIRAWDFRIQNIRRQSVPKYSIWVRVFSRRIGLKKAAVKMYS